ncbi:putative pteridine transporter [Novymonas esmeraldas]|uniref:Pteridine transporter n=1 Tax=Novymonas esmeraldas TaxID=1808958 RepID=A0AAW0F7D4_9TRYP
MGPRSGDAVARATDGDIETADSTTHVTPQEKGASAVQLPSEASPHYIHPDATRLFAAAPYTRHIPLFAESCEGVGPKCTAALGAVYFLNKGLSKNLVALSRYAMFRTRFGIDGTRYQRLAALYNMGQSVKAFSASVSDTFALFGYTKRWYCAGSCIAGAAFALAFGLLPAKESSANTGAGFMFLVCFCMANVDIFSQGHYSRILRKRPEAGPHLVSWIWFFILCSGIVSAGIQGPLSDKSIPQVGLFVAAAAQVLTAPFFIFNWYGERTNRVERYEDVLAVNEATAKSPTSALTQKTSPREPVATAGVKELDLDDVGVSSTGRRGCPDTALSDGLVLHEAADASNVEDDEDKYSAYTTTLCGGAVEVNKEVFVRNWRLFVYSAVMVCAVVAQCVVTVYGKSRDLAWSSIAVAVVCCSMGFWACSFVTAKAIVFIFLDMVLYIQIPGVMDSFYMAPKSCLPDGPHFTFVFYNTVAAIIGNLGGIAGVICFSYIFSRRSYCMTFIVTTLVKVVSSVFDIIIVKRWNLHVGIPDHAMYIMGDAVVFQVCSEFAWIPVVLLFSRICPRGSESMIYALAAGFGNVGQSMSNTIGSLFIELVWPIKSKGVCDFSNVPMLLLVSHILLPLAVIPLSILLLPSARICDDLDDDGNAIRTGPKGQAHATAAENATTDTRASDSASRTAKAEESRGLEALETLSASGHRPVASTETHSEPIKGHHTA